MISNPPYISFEETSLMPQNVLKYEPQLALFVNHDDPIIFYKKIANLALRQLHENGFLFFEINEFNAKRVIHYLQKLHFQQIILENDINGKPRMIRAIRPTL